MKKEDFSGVIVYLVILALAIIFGTTVLQQHASECGLSTAVYIVYILGAIALGVIINAFLFEWAHYAGAKVGGYEVISVAVLSLTWVKEGDNYVAKFGGYDGLTGETKIAPRKDLDKEANPKPFLLFGTLFYLIEIAIIITLFLILTRKDASQTEENIAYFFLVIGVLGGMILIYNILPFRLDAMTDGYRLTLVSNPANTKAFNELLRVEYAIACGETDVEIATFTEITNFTAELNLNKVYLALDKRDFKTAEEVLDVILAGKDTMSQKTYLRAKAQKIYIQIMTRDIEEARKFYDEEVPMAERREFPNDHSMASIRAYLLMAGVLDKSKSECMLCMKNVQVGFRKTLKTRQKTEVELFNEAIDKVDSLHPDWKLTDYKLKVVEETKK